MAAQHKFRHTSKHLGTFEDFRGLFSDAREPVESQPMTSYAQPTADGGNPSAVELKSNGQLVSQLTARTPILLRTLFRTVDNSIMLQKTPGETSSRFFPLSSQAFKAAKSSPESASEGRVKSNREGFNSVQDGATQYNNAPVTFRSGPEKGYSEAPSPPAPALPPPPIILRETVSVCVKYHEKCFENSFQQQPPPIQRVIEQVLVPMEVLGILERQVPVPVPVIQQVSQVFSLLFHVKVTTFSSFV